jgi:hypothetical protein
MRRTNKHRAARTHFGNHYTGPITAAQVEALANPGYLVEIEVTTLRP